MKNHSLKSVLYRRPDNRKTVPAFVLCQNGELTMIFVPCKFDTHPDFILLAHDDDCDGIYEDAESNWFTVESKDLSEIGNNLQMLLRKRS